MLKYLLKMVIFHSYVKVYQRVMKHGLLGNPPYMGIEIGQ